GAVETLARSRRRLFVVAAQRSRGLLFALDRRTGEVCWRAPCAAEMLPHVHEPPGVVLATDLDTESLTAYDAAGGKRLWELSADGQPLVPGSRIDDLVV